MIDKILAAMITMTVLIQDSVTAPTTIHIQNLNGTVSEDPSSFKNITSNSSITTDSSTISLTLERNFNLNRTMNETNANLVQKIKETEQLQVNSSSSKSNLKARKNNNDLFFCCTDDTIESLSFPYTKNKDDHEKNTKSPIVKRKKSHEEEEPYMERRPALLLRFFPDGTAVLISKFQLHLHVKPKQIKYESDDETEDEEIELNPRFILNNGKSYEVTYKRLEAIPSLREQNEFDLDESEEREALTKDLNYSEHEFITTNGTSTIDNNKPSVVDTKLSPFHENISPPSQNTTESKNFITAPKNESNANKSEKLLPVVGDSPFFMMTEEEMSSLQKQYDPSVASPLRATTSFSNNNGNNVQPTTTPISTMSLERTTVTTSPKSTFNTSSTTTKCLSFKNQLSLALSTEDNIDNSLLKRHIFPTLDCDNSSSAHNPFDNLKKSHDIITVTPSALPIITRLLPEPTTTPSYTQNNIAPYLASHLSHHPTNPGIFVVTSLPMLIDLKSTRKPATNPPSWREVTVGVVRDQQGQPLKPRYNNWTAHLRGLRKKAENKFWNDFTTPKPNLRTHPREPLQQNIQHSPSQIHRAFWTDLQRQNQMSRQRNEDRMNTHMYLTNPPKDYPFHNKNKFQFWRLQAPGTNSGWNRNSNSNAAKYSRTIESHRNLLANFGGVENQQNTQWNQGNQGQNSRRW